MECWNIGNKSGDNLFKLSKNPLNSSFHYSIIPIFSPGPKPCRPEANWGEAPESKFMEFFCKITPLSQR
jgi:hypothetical protein